MRAPKCQPAARIDGPTCGRRPRLKTLRTVSLVSLLALAACAEHRVDTFSEWCEQITGVDLEEKYSPFWAVIFSVSFDGNGVRDDYVQFLNNTLLEVVENRADRMAWRDGADLHLQNVSGLMDVEPEVAISDWQAGIGGTSIQSQRTTATYASLAPLPACSTE